MSSASKLSVIRFEPAHFAQLQLQASQAYVRGHMTDVRLAAYAEHGPAYSFFAGEVLVCCGGVREIDARRGVLWSFVSPAAGAHFTALHRCAVRLLETFDRSHLQATCRTGFDAGARWLDLLGFTWSRSLGPYGPARVPHELFERVRTCPR